MSAGRIELVEGLIHLHGKAPSRWILYVGVGGAESRSGSARTDVSLTGCGGVVALAELIERLDLLGALDAGIGLVKPRDRGARAGEVTARPLLLSAGCHP